MSFFIEDFERIPDLDQMYLREKEQEMFVEWQMWEEEQEKLGRIPAKIEIFTPKLQEHEDESDTLSL